MAETELTQYRDRLMDLQKSVSDKDEAFMIMKSDSVLLRQEIFNKNKDLDTMGNIIDEHS